MNFTEDGIPQLSLKTHIDQDAMDLGLVDKNSLIPMAKQEELVPKKRQTLQFEDQLATDLPSSNMDDHPRQLKPRKTPRSSYHVKNTVHPSRDTSDVSRVPDTSPPPDYSSGFELRGNPKVKKSVEIKPVAPQKRIVYVRVQYMKLGEVDTIKEQYMANVFIQARWREPELEKQLPRPLKSIDLSSLWSPNLQVQNQVDSKYYKVWNDVKVGPDGHVYAYEKMRIHGSFTESMELQNFPFDTQHLSLLIACEDSNVEFEEDNFEPSTINRATFADEQEWTIREAVEMEMNFNKQAESGIQPKQPSVLIIIYATRRGGFFIWNILFLMALICSLGICIFSINLEDTQQRLQSTFTLILTGVTFKFASNSSLPKIDYLTVLDQYIIHTMIVLHLNAVWHAVIGFVARKTDSDITEVLDMVAFIIVVTEFIVAQIIAAAYILHQIKTRDRLMLEIENAYKLKLKQIDRNYRR